MFRRLLLTALAALTLAAPAASAATKRKASAPSGPAFSCAGAICVDAATGKVLAEENADVRHAPASVTKLMTLLVVLDEIDAGRAKLTDTVTADKEAWQFIGSKVALAIGERHTLDEMLYALMVQSANDGAIAIAKHIGGSTEGFVAKMNARAASLGLSRTRFTSPHGYPAGSKREDDMTSARDLSVLARELLRHRLTLQYSATKTYRFRPATGDVKADAPGTYNNLSNHNKLLWTFAGCDGLKTGWSGDGASIVTTASRGNKRVIAVVLGGKVPAADGTPQAKPSQSECRKYAAKLMEDGLAALGVSGAAPTGFTPAPSGSGEKTVASSEPAPAPGSAAAPAPAPESGAEAAPKAPARSSLDSIRF